MSIREISFPSANGRDTVKAWAYSPLGKPRAIIQLIHGYGEHSRRYLHMIGAFNAAGFVVYADDHIGHGKTGYDGGTLGDPHSGGYMTYVKDEKSLHDIAVADYPDIPYFVFGHSWGSMLARCYAAHFGEDIVGLMLCGLCSQWKGCEDAYVNQEFIDAYDPRVVADHAGDMFNTFDTTLELVWDFVQLYHFIESDEWAPMVPSRIPTYLIAGDQDPCGNYGEGLYHVANLLARTGNKTITRAYTGYRHEIHNELTIRDEVEAGLIEFVNQVLG